MFFCFIELLVMFVFLKFFQGPYLGRLTSGGFCIGKF